jgi:hypothetical protein
MEKDILLFFADNYCPFEIYYKGANWSTCPIDSNNRDSACARCWEKAIAEYGEPSDVKSLTT